MQPSLRCRDDLICCLALHREIQHVGPTTDSGRREYDRSHRLVPKALLAAASIKVDDTSALLVIDVQNCFLPGGSLAVKEGDQVVPVINKIAKGFANVVMTQDWHTAGHVSFASAIAAKNRSKPSISNTATGAVAGSLRAGNRWRIALKGPVDSSGRTHHSKRFSQGCR